MTTKLPKSYLAMVKAVGLKVVERLSERVLLAAAGEKLAPPRLPVAPLKQLLGELDQDRRDR